MTALEAAARAHDLTCHIRLLHFLLLIISIFSFCLVGARFISHVDKREPTLTGVSLAVVVLVVCLPCNVICITKPSLATTIKQTGALYLSWSARQEMMCQLALGETSRLSFGLIIIDHLDQTSTFSPFGGNFINESM